MFSCQAVAKVRTHSSTLYSPQFVIPREARDLYFAAHCRSLASLGMTIHRRCCLCRFGPNIHHELSRLHHEFNPLHRSRGILIDQGQITRRQVYEFPPPSRVGNFHAQNTVGTTQRPSPLGDRTATRDRPGQHRALACTRATKRFGDDVFQVGGSTVQGMTPDSRMRSERRLVTAIGKTIGKK
jgi:hypothetical protein